METIGYLLTAITLIWLWETNHQDVLFKKIDAIRFMPRNKLCEYLADHKPFNCITCLTVWIGIILFFILGFNIYFLSLPIFYKLILKFL